MGQLLQEARSSLGAGPKTAAAGSLGDAEQQAMEEQPQQQQRHDHQRPHQQEQHQQDLVLELVLVHLLAAAQQCRQHLHHHGAGRSCGSSQSAAGGAAAQEVLGHVTAAAVRVLNLLGSSCSVLAGSTAAELLAVLLQGGVSAAEHGTAETATSSGSDNSGSVVVQAYEQVGQAAGLLQRAYTGLQLGQQQQQQQSVYKGAQQRVLAEAAGGLLVSMLGHLARHGVAVAAQQLLQLLLATSGTAAVAVRQVGVDQLAQVQQQVLWHLQHLQSQQQEAAAQAAKDVQPVVSGQQNDQCYQQQLQLQALLVVTSSALLERCSDADVDIAAAARAAVHAAGLALLCFVALHRACSTLHDISSPQVASSAAAAGAAGTKEPSKGPVPGAAGAEQLPSSMVLGVGHPLLGSLARQAQQRGFTPPQLATLFGLLFQVGAMLWPLHRAKLLVCTALQQPWACQTDSMPPPPT